MEAWTGIKIMKQIWCEPGKGACIVDAKNSQVKGFMLHNIAHGICDVVCAQSYCENIMANGGLDRVIAVCMEAEDVQAMQERWPAPTSVEGIAKVN